MTSETSYQIVNNSLSHKYMEVLKLSFKFFEAQRSGVLPYTNSIPWRGNSGLNDFNSEWDVIGGFYNCNNLVIYLSRVALKCREISLLLFTYLKFTHTILKR